MPASASPPPNVPFPAYNAPHARGPASYQQPGHVLTKQQHRHGYSADYADPNLGQKPLTSQHAHARLSQQNLSKPLPTKPEQDYATYSRQSGRSAAEQYKQQSLQKLDGKDSRGRSSADLPSGHAPPGSIGRRATVDARPSSAQAATRGSNGARRKPVREPSPAEFFEWNPTDEPQVLTTPITTDMPSSSHKSRNRHMGVYRDAPALAPTWSKGTAPRPEERYNHNLSASVGHQQGSQPTHYMISSSSLGRHHSASASVPVVLPGSARTVQGVFQSNTPTGPVHPSSNQKIPYTSTSNSTTPTPKAQNFNNISKHSKHASISNQEFPTMEDQRRRKVSHHRNASASTQAASPSSCSTTGSSHCDTWRSENSQASHRQRPRGISDAPAPQTHYLGKTMGVSDVSVGRAEDEDRGRGRKQEKEDTSFIGRIRSRSNSLTKGIAKVINYPKYLKEKGEEKKKEREAKRQSKQQTLGQGNSAILATSTSDNGHSIAYSYTTSSSNATSTSTTNSPISHRSNSAQPRPKKLVSQRDQQLKNDYRASPMTKAKDHVLREYWDDMDLDPRMSGVPHAQIQVDTRFVPMVVPFSRDEPRLRRR